MLANLGFRQRAILFVGILAMAGVECCYFLDDESDIKRMAAITWICLALGGFAMSAILAAAPFLSPSFWKSPSKAWYIIAALLPVLLIYIGLNGTAWTPMNTEGAAQDVIGMDLLRHDHDLGIYTAAYYGRYIARQYVLASLPTFAFGPSFAALRIGNSFGYVISYLVFLSAMATYLSSRGVNGLFWSSWAGMMVALGQYPLIQARMFEQTTMPLAATLMVAAAVLYFLSKPSPARVLWIAWSMGYLTCGYTPAYASWALAACVLAYLALHPKYNHRILLLALAQGLVSLLVAVLIVRRGGELLNIVRAGPPPGLSLSAWLWRYFDGFTAVYNAGFSVIPVPLGAAALLVLCLGVKRRDWRAPLVFLWCCAVVAASLTMLGSFFDKPHYDVHRSMIILPIIAAGIAMFYAGNFSGHPNARIIERVAAYSMVYMIYTSASFPLLNRWYFYRTEMSDLDEAALRISEVAHDPRLPPIKDLCIDPAVKLNDFDLKGSLEYFFPEAKFTSNATPIPWLGSYILEYNDRPRGPDYRSFSKRELQYITLHPVAESAAYKGVLQRIRANRGLIADYRFAEGSGGTAADKDGNFEPASLSKGVSWVRSGTGSAVSLSGWDSYLSLPPMAIEAEALTVAMWVKWNGGLGNQGLLRLGEPGSPYIYLSRVAKGDLLRLLVQTPLPPKLAQMVMIDTRMPAPGIWTLVTVELTGDEAVLWVNGAPAGRNRITMENPHVLRNFHNWVGHSSPGDSDFMGTIGRIQLYDRALTDAEVAALAVSPPP